jgi:hypothetical protein
MKRFLSTKNRFTVVSLWSIAIVLVILLILNIIHEDLTLLPIVILSVVIALIIWILLDTRYVIKQNFLLYRSGPFRGRIDIKKIDKIRRFSGLYVPVNVKPALGTKGFIITYNNIKDVYVSPKKAEAFIEELLKINPKIEVI